MAGNPYLSRPLEELAEESARLISELSALMFREWTQTEWQQGVPQKSFSDSLWPDRSALLGNTSLRLAAWAEEHKSPEQRTRFVKRCASFLDLLVHVNSVLCPPSHLGPFGPYFCPLQPSQVLLDNQQKGLAILAGTHLPETLRAWAAEMRAGGDDGRNSDATRQTQDADDGQDGGYDGIKAEYRELARWAMDDLKGKQRRAVELLIEHNGRIAISDLATDPAIDWQKPFDDAFNSLKQALKEKLSKLGWRIFRQSNEARLDRRTEVKVGQK